jgi:hypothetical protein
MSRKSEVGINVRAGNAVQRQHAFLVVPRQHRWSRWVNSGRASDSRDSSGAKAEGGHPDGPGVHCHRRCSLHYFSRAGSFLRSVLQEGPYERFDGKKRGRRARACVEEGRETWRSLINSVRLHGR